MEPYTLCVLSCNDERLEATDVRNGIHAKPFWYSRRPQKEPFLVHLSTTSCCHQATICNSYVAKLCRYWKHRLKCDPSVVLLPGGHLPPKHIATSEFHTPATVVQGIVLVRTVYSRALDSCSDEYHRRGGDKPRQDRINPNKAHF